MNRTILLSAVFCLLTGIIFKGYAMSFFKGEELYYFSGFEGQVLLNGKPAIGALVHRTAESKGKIVVDDKEITDSEGRFKFSSVMKKTKTGSILQFVSHQKIFITHNGEKKQVWEAGKIRTEEYVEFGDEKKSLICELSDEMKPFYMVSGFGMTLCDWEGIKRNQEIEL